MKQSKTKQNKIKQSKTKQNKKQNKPNLNKTNQTEAKQHRKQPEGEELASIPTSKCRELLPQNPNALAPGQSSEDPGNRSDQRSQREPVK